MHDLFGRTRFMDPKEAARFLELSRAALYKLVERQRIPFFRLGRRIRFDRQRLEAFVRGEVRAGESR
jgi:excisionase family DNA binding protein